MRIRVVIIGTALASIALAGCVPAMTRHSPAVTGTLKLDGVPVAGARVFANWNRDAACHESKVLSVTVTDKDGSFALPVGRAFEWYPLIVLGDYGYGWRLCFEYNAHSYLGIVDMGWGRPPETFRVECDLSNDAHACKRLEGGT